MVDWIFERGHDMHRCYAGSRKVQKREPTAFTFKRLIGNKQNIMIFIGVKRMNYTTNISFSYIFLYWAFLQLVIQN